MSEFLFAVKCLFITALITVFMQVKVGDQSIERHSQWLLQRSTVSIYIQSVAAGGALAVRNLFTSVKNGVTGTVESYREGARAQR